VLRLKGQMLGLVHMLFAGDVAVSEVCAVGVPSSLTLLIVIVASS